MNKIILVLCLILTASLFAGSDDSDKISSGEDIEAVEIQKALDKTVEFAVEDLAIDQMFKKLGDATSVTFRISKETFDFLPSGSRTIFNVRFKAVRLRDALTTMLSSSALRWKIDSGVIVIMPTSALERLNRRASYDEIDLLGKIYSSEMELFDVDDDHLSSLRKAVKSPDLRLHWVVDRQLAQQALKHGQALLPCSPAKWLVQICRSQKWTWYLSGETIMVITKKHQIERMLQSRITLAYSGAKLIDVLLDLQKQSKTNFKLAPGVLLLVNEQMRQHFGLVISDGTINQALQAISGMTGLVFEIEDDAISVKASETLRKEFETRPATKKSSPFYLKVSIPTGKDGGVVEVFYSAQDLPDDVVENLLNRRDKLVNQIRKSMINDQ